MTVGADAVGAYIHGLDEDLTERFNGYRTHLQTQPLAANTRRTYAGRGWLPQLARRVQLDALNSARGRLRQRSGDRGWSPNDGGLPDGQPKAQTSI